MGSVKQKTYLFYGGIKQSEEVQDLFNDCSLSHKRLQMASSFTVTFKSIGYLNTSRLLKVNALITLTVG